MTKDSIFDEQNRLPRDLAEGWYKFEKVGDKVGGTIIDMFESAGTGTMPAQLVFTVRTEDGKVLNVGLKRTDYILGRTNMLQVGDELGVKFEKEIPAKQKGYSPAKSMIIYTKLHGERNVLQSAGALQPTQSEADKEFDAIGAENDTPQETPF